MSTLGTFCVFEPKILSTPQPPDHVSVPTPITPEESRRAYAVRKTS